MKEGIAGRVSRIIAGGFYAMVDAVESAAPEVVMEQAVREVDEAIDEVRAELGKEVANKHLRNRKLKEMKSEYEQLTEKLELALKETREDLAEAAIARQLDLEAQIPIVEGGIEEAGAREAKLEGYILALRAKKREMQEDLKAYRASRAKSAPVGNGTSAPGASSLEVQIEKAEAAFSRVLERETGQPGNGNSDSENARQLAELEEMSRTTQIRERLEAAKAKAGA